MLEGATLRMVPILALFCVRIRPLQGHIIGCLMLSSFVQIDTHKTQKRIVDKFDKR